MLLREIWEIKQQLLSLILPKSKRRRENHSHGSHFKPLRGTNFGKHAMLLHISSQQASTKHRNIERATLMQPKIPIGSSVNTRDVKEPLKHDAYAISTIATLAACTGPGRQRNPQSQFALHIPTSIPFVELAGFSGKLSIHAICRFSLCQLPVELQRSAGWPAGNSVCWKTVEAARCASQLVLDSPGAERPANCWIAIALCSQRPKHQEYTYNTITMQAFPEINNSTKNCEWDKGYCKQNICKKWMSRL